jgi:carboxylesterase
VSSAAVSSAEPAVLPGAEAWSSAGSGSWADVGVLVLHGFTGTPQGVRGWAESLAAHGLTVSVPRLPGHGTRWQDLQRTRWQDWFGEAERALTDLQQRCSTVFVAGLSVGGALTLRLAETHPEIAGIVTVNASLATRRPEARLLPLVRWIVPSFPGVVGDIKKPGVTEVGYPRLPLHAVHSLSRLWALTRADLGRIGCPVLAFRSAVDHVVEPVSGELLVAGVRAGGAPVEERVLAESYHVATLDNDAPAIMDGTWEFIRRVSGR